jgi:hypothetical protein
VTSPTASATPAAAQRPVQMSDLHDDSPAIVYTAPMLLALALACATPDPVTKPVDVHFAADPTAVTDTAAPDADLDGSPDDVDCDDDDPDVFPGAEEACNATDDDCDGQIDEDFDADGDGWLLDIAACDGLPGAGDCDDDDPDVSPDAQERCNDIDDDCNGRIDDVEDDDGDGFDACEDCDDADPDVFPGAEELCNGVDDDCSGAADEPFDGDGDGAHLPEICDGRDNDCDDQIDEGFDEDGDGVATCRGDCDDDDPTVYLGAEELCDGVDNDCDPSTTEEGDLDGDGFSTCTGGDCDDLDPLAYPGGVETCDGHDNDCSGVADDLDACWDCHVSGDYLICAELTDWDHALELCTGFGGGLVVIEDAAENTAVANAANLYTGNDPWIGFSDQWVEGSFEWYDGTPVTFTSWYAGEPNDSGGEDCAATNFVQNGRWNDYPCSYALPFVCEL